MSSLSLHDIRLLGIPVVFAISYIVGYLLIPSQIATLAVASVMSGILVVDCLFLHPPSDE